MRTRDTTRRSARRCRGVYLQPSPPGTVRIQAVDSTGAEYLHLLIDERAYSDRLVSFLRELLDEGDPVGQLVLLPPSPR